MYSQEEKKGLKCMRSQGIREDKEGSPGRDGALPWQPGLPCTFSSIGKNHKRDPQTKSQLKSILIPPIPTINKILPVRFYVVHEPRFVAQGAAQGEGEEGGVGGGAGGGKEGKKGGGGCNELRYRGECV